MYDEQVRQEKQQVREPIAERIVKQAAGVALEAEELKSLAYNRLSPIMGSPMVGTGSDKNPEESFPPLFQELRKSLQSINDSLLAIREALNLIEI